jgi:hypothetical protein
MQKHQLPFPSRGQRLAAKKKLAERRAAEQQIRENLARQFSSAYISVHNVGFQSRMWLGLN